MEVWKWGSLAAIIVVGVTIQAHANQIDAGKVCAAIPDSLQRLSCFDKAFPKVQPSPTLSATDTTATETWEIQREKSAIDDSPSVFASLMPKESEGTGLGRKDLWLIARCTENTTSVFVVTSMFMTDDPKVTVRIGDAPAHTSIWPKSTNYKSAGLWNGATAIPFLKSLKDNQRLVVRVEERDRQDATFDLGKVEAVVAEIATACKWTQ